MALVYTASFEDISVSAAQDLFELLAPADAVLEIISVEVAQNSDYGDAEAEGLSIAIVRGEGSVTSGSGGSTVTPAPHEAGFPASGATVERNNTTKMAVGTGTLTTVRNSGFNIQVGYLYQPMPEERLRVSPSDRLTVELVGAPTDALTVSGSVCFLELGG